MRNDGEHEKGGIPVNKELRSRAKVLLLIRIVCGEIGLECND